MLPLGIFFFHLLFGFRSSALATSYASRTYDYGHSIKSFLQKRDANRNDSQNALVESIPYNGTIPLRPEFRELQNNHEQWTLYLLAMSWMQWMNQSDPTSWYAITDYGGVKALPGNSGNGYCAHVSNLFPSWHRPYLALYEQTIYKVINMIAAWYPEDRREAFQKSAANFRIPYWDWAVKPSNGTSAFPLALGESSDVEIDGPNGKQNISNPLFSYTFKPLDPSIFEEYPFMYWIETKRRPMPLQGINATSDNAWVAQTLDKSLPSIQQRLYNLFANYGNYSTWSNEAWISDGNNSSLDSIESLHDTIHLACGGNFGHMAIIAYSSFDPIFFLHHANVDRLFSMWQTVYNDSWVEPMKAILPTRTINMGDNQTSLTDLTPFYYNTTHFWNSDQVRDHKVFGYSYADVVSGNRSDVIATINKLYTDFSPAIMHIQAKRDAIFNHTTSKGHKFQAVPLEWLVKNGTYREWTANIAVNKFALGASFSVHLFFGEIPLFPVKWEQASNKIGTLGIFAGSHAHASMGPLRIGGSIPLTGALVDLVTSGKLHSLNPHDVDPFLRQKLGFKIMHNNGSDVEPGLIDGLHISVVSASVAAPETEVELPNWSTVDTYINIY